MSTNRDHGGQQSEATSAFGVTGDVTWETGWGDEDLAGSAPAPAQAAPPRPAETQAPAAPVAPPVPATVPAPPAAPARPDLAPDLEVPEWAQVRPAEPQPPQAPLAPPAPAAPVIAPPPAVTPTPVAAPTPAPAVTPAPAPVVAPTPAPVERYDHPRHDPAPAPVQQPVAPTPAAPSMPMPQAQPESRGRKRGPGKPKSRGKAADSTRPTGRGNAFAGGRWKTKILRGLIYSVLVLLLIGGLRNIIAPKSGPSADEITATVRTSLGDTGFPTTAAEGFAVRFANTYLNYDAETREARTLALATYSQEASEGIWGWTGSEGTQQVINGPFIAAKPVVKDRSNALVTVAAQVSGGAWVYLSIPVYANERGALVISGPPAFVSPPARAVAPGASAPAADDDTLVQTLTTDVLPGYFKAWAASNTVDLARYITPDATAAASSGLTGAVTLAQIGEVRMPRDGGDTRTGQVSVTWTAKGAGSFVQAYELTVVKDGSGRWSVKDIVGGVVSPSGSGDTATPTAPATPAPTDSAAPADL